LIVMSAVAPAKGNLVVDERNESMIGDGDAMGVVCSGLNNAPLAPHLRRGVWSRRASGVGIGFARKRRKL
jgi:hypothetical protein